MIRFIPRFAKRAQTTIGLSALLVLVACGGGGTADEVHAQPPSSTAKLPHSGITLNQCYAAGSNTLVACSSAEAIALSGAGKQDGMYASVNAMTYSAVPGYSKEECVQDKVTGLMWEGKTASGTRAGSNTYTNLGNNAANDASGYVKAVNDQALCGHADWRLPTVDELQGIVDYGKPYPGPTIDALWFPNTKSDAYWSASPYAGGASGAWFVYFSDGDVDYDYRVRAYAVRLVRASQ